MEVLILKVIIVFVVVIISMTLHEAMHAYVSYVLGDDTAKMSGRLTLNPIKHIDPFMTLILPITLAILGLPIFGGAKPVPLNYVKIKYQEFGMALVALAGPLTNLLIAFVTFGMMAIIKPEGIVLNILMLGVMVNLGFFVFNMIPIPPLDGSRVIYALAPDFVRKAMEQMERYGIIVIFVVIMLARPVIGPFMGSAIMWLLDIFQLVFKI